ncbi:MAG: 4-alpha-glucanotransferase [Actinomycetota bacterium]|nr:4-alpha-glucanotransferase [Actinomycetota bacterium]
METPPPPSLLAPLAPLARLAQAHGIATDYTDWQGVHAPVGNDSIRAVLAALEVPAATAEEVEASLVGLDRRSWRRTLPPTVVCRTGWTPWVAVHVPHGTGVELVVELEEGGARTVTQVDRVVEPREVDGVLVGEATFELPDDLPTGWHRLVARGEAQPLLEGSDVTVLVVTPARLTLPAGLGERRATGVMTQLYQARSSASWGVGDLGDLADLGTWAAEEHGADFVLVNPLHAAEPVAPMEPSPYLPSSRRFLNPLYLRVEDVPEAARLEPDAHARLRALGVLGRALTDGGGIARDASWELKREGLALVHAVPPTPARSRAYRRFCAMEGAGLTAYATWCAIADELGLPWSQWPVALQDPASPEVAAFAAAHADRVDLHRWMQWLMAEQVASVQSALRRAGMRIGIVEDLAVGVSPWGSDGWSLGGTLASGVTVGAPPDQFNQLGQNWNQPPWRPDRLAEQGYAPFRDMVRTALRDSGGLRIDHIIGLFRLWWIPAGLTPDHGTYVRYDHEALIGILVLEAERAGAVVIGEDLGVVEPTARDYLLERGLLGTSILWFEWDGERPRPPETYRDLCLSSVTTHDLPPTAGYLGLEHVTVRESLGLLTRSAQEEREVELAAIETVRSALLERGLLDESVDGSDGREGADAVLVALHRWIAQTPSRMLAVALADLVGDHRAVNQPGTHDEYPNWRVPLAGPDGTPVLLDEIVSGGAAHLAGPVFAALRADGAASGT